MDSTVGLSRSHCPCGDNGCYINGDVIVGSTEIVNEELAQENATGNEDLHKGRVFSTHEEAYNCYVSFAKKVDFSVRRDRYLGSEEHPMGIYKRDYVCHRAGSPRSQKVVEKERQRDRKSSRCNCNAKMSIVKELIDGIPRWIVLYFDNVHNHELLNEKEVRFLPAYRNIDIIDQKRITLLAKAGCLMSLIRRVLELEKGIDVGQLSFTEKDIRNFLQLESSTNIEYDALELLKVCKSLKDKDVDFQYDFTVDACQRLEHIIWAFGDSTHAYEIFGDVVVFDTTYRLNRYEMSLGVWIGVNNHGNSVFFGCVLLRNEKASSFSWALKSFVRLMKGKHPQTILTDQDLGLTEAIANELPHTKHAFCIWHITSKFSTWFSFPLGSRYVQFKSEFHKIYELGTIEEFEQQWDELIAKFDLESDRHIKLLYANRASWALPYLKGYFFAGMTTTSRSESINAYLKKFLHARTSLKEFVEQVGAAVSIRNYAAEEAIMRQQYYNPQIKTFMPMEKNASKVLTPFAFKLLQNEMILSVEYGLFSNGDDSYIVRHYSKIDGGRLVYWNPLEEVIRCSCQEFEFSGILCRHCIRVLSSHNYFMLPDKYFLPRWRQENSLVLKFTHTTNPPNDANEFHSLQSIIRDLSLESMKSKGRLDCAKKELERVLQVVQCLPENEHIHEEHGQFIISQTTEHDSSDDDYHVENPQQSQTKGRKRGKRLVGGVEAAKKPRYCHVPNCGGTGHDSRNCPLKRKTIEIPLSQSPNKIPKGWRKKL